MPPRLRQAVLVAPEPEPVVEALRRELGAGAPYEDPDVAIFGLRNAVLPLGDTFLEVVAPVREGTAAGRHLERRGPGGYMLLVQVEDVAGARERARAEGVRTAWEIDLDDISATHLHPADTGATILSLDEPRPPASWRWAGPDWTGRAGDGPPGRVTGATLTVPDPPRTAALWARILGLPEPVDGAATLALADGGELRFAPGPDALTAVHVALPGGGGERVVGGLRFRPGAAAPDGAGGTSTG